MRPTHKLLGDALRQLREENKLTQRQAADELGMSPQTLSRLELGLNERPDVDDVDELLELYGADASTRERVSRLARFVSSRPRRRSSVEMGERQRDYAELEAAAIEINEYQQLVLPSLLQTPGYARVRLDSTPGEPDQPPHVELRGHASRQQVLRRERPPLRYEALFDESVLHRPLAPRAESREQLRHLLELAGRPNITLRVIASSAKVGDYLAPPAAFSLYRSPAWNTVVVPTLTRDVHLHDEKEVAVFETVLTWLRNAALSPEASQELIAALVDDNS